MMEPITMYTTTWCPDCRRVKSFLKLRGIEFNEINIEDNEDAEAVVLRANRGKRKVPTLKMGERYFACSPFNPLELAAQLDVSLNP
jgi:mycoredoxin